MGFTPQQVNEMSIWQFIAACDGVAKSRSGKGAKLSSEEADELWALISGDDEPVEITVQHGDVLERAIGLLAKAVAG